MFRKAWLCVAVCVCAAISGCQSASLIVGVSEPDLAVIEQGTTRAQAERVLGRPQWRLGVADGAICDVYQFEAEREAAPGVGVMTLGLGILSFGASELLLSDARKFAAVHQVAAAYDQQDRVVFVTDRWQPAPEVVGPGRKMRKIIPSESGAPLRALPDPDDSVRGASRGVSVLDLRKGRSFTVQINGQRRGRERLELPPGRHTVEFRWRAANAFIDAATLEDAPAQREIKLLPGRVYTLMHKRYYGFPQRKADVVWIEDAASGEVIDAVWGVLR